jgi:hypothetical protein
MCECLLIVSGAAHPFDPVFLINHGIGDIRNGFDVPISVF